MSQRVKNAIWVAFFFFIVPAGVILDRCGGGPLRSLLYREAFYSDDQQRYHRQTFTVLAVVDGDTIDIDCPDGDEPYTRVRLLGIDTPETKHPRLGVMYYGPEASDFVTRTVEGRPVTLLLDTLADQRDFYGRLLAYVQLEDGTILNETIIERGFGYADLRFEHTHAARYEVLMDRGVAERVGLWKAVTRDQFPQWLRQKRPTLLR